MGVSSATNRVALVGDGSTTTFSFAYYFFAQTDLVVYLYDTVAGSATLKVLNTHYTITGSVNAQGLYQSGGSVVFVTAPTATQIVVIFRSPAQTQIYSLGQNGLISSSALVQQLDYLTLLAQRLEDQVTRAVQIPDGLGATFSATLPSTIALAANQGATIVVNAGGTGFDLGPTAGTITGATASAAAAAASASAASGSASSASTSATNAATSATNAATSATSSATSATAAAASAAAAATSVVLTGDVTGSGTGTVVTTIAAGHVTNAMHTNMANSTVKGNVSGSTGAPTDLTTAQLHTLLADITALTGDVTATGAGGSTAATIAASAVTNAKMANVTAHTYKGNNTGSTAAPADISAANVLADISPLTTKGDLLGFSTLNARIAVGTNAQVLTADSTQATGLKWANSAGGGGSKNYLSVMTASTASGVANTGNGDFELGATTGWALGTATLTNNFPSGVPTFGSGASGNLSIAAVSSAQLAGLTSMSYVSSAATTAGNFVASSAFFIDLEDQAKCLTFKFAYSAITNPTNANWSGTSSNSFGVALYDVTNSVWIQPSGVYAMTQSSGVGIATGTFQTSSNGTSYRIAIYNANATSGAFTMYLDDISVGPVTVPIGAVITDWVAYTPTFTGLGTVSGVNVRSRRVGDSLELMGSITTGTTSGVTAAVTLGYNGANGNVTIDSSKVQSEVVGWASQAGSSTTFFHISVLASAGTGNLNFGAQTSTTNETAAATGSSFASSTSAFQFYAKVPITGWSSNVLCSIDSDTRVVSASARISANFAASTTTPINYDTVITDTHGAITTSATAWKFNAPVSGYYRIQVVHLSTATSGNIYVYVNGVQLSSLGLDSTSCASGGMTVKVNANDFIDIRPGVAITFDANGGPGVFNRVYIDRLSGPSVIAATESVGMRYTSITATTISTSFAVVPFNVFVKDTHGLYSTSTGLYAITTPGLYSIKATIGTAALTLGTAQGLQIAAYKSLAQYSILNSIFGSGGGGQGYVISGSDDIPCVAGDTLALYATCGVASALTTNANVNHLAIVRVGN